MKLQIGSELKLPLEAATESFAILGRRGSGKTHTAVVVAEELLKAAVQVVVIDPLDVWWGLRVSKDGKHGGFAIYVAGGSHQDIPLSADAGKVLADAVVDQGLSIVLSVRHLSKTDQRRFVGDFCDRLYDRKADPQHRTALHVFIDEADAFVPQRLVPGTEKCFGAVDTLVRRGRSSGLAPTLISQRPQVINKDVLSQTEVLVAHQLTGPQDRKALETWIEANDTENRRAEFMGSLASLPKGRAWFWSPGLLAVFKPVNVRDRETFDSSSTPKPGVQGIKPKAFAAVDLAKLTTEIQATIAKQKADDPRELRKRIAELERAASKKCEKPAERAVTVDRAVLTDADRELLKTLGEEFREFGEAIADKADTMLTSLAERAKAEIDRAVGVWVENIDKRRALFIDRLNQTRIQKILAKLEGASAPRIAGRREELPSRATPGPAPARRAELGSRVRQPPSSTDGLTPVERRILNALAELEVLGAKEPERELVAFLSNYSNLTSKGFRNALSSLNTAGLIEYPTQGTVKLTERGRADAEWPEAPSSSREVQERVLRLLGGKASEILRPIIDAYPHAIERDAVAAAANYTNLTSKGFRNVMSRLSALGFVTYPSPGTVVAAPVLFLEGR